MRFVVVPSVSAFAALLALLAATTAARAQSPDLSGTWNFQVQTSAGGGSPTVTLVQKGDDLTGHYSSSNLGEADLTGTVDGSDVEFEFDVSVQGTNLHVTYSGAVQEDGSLEGSMDLGGMASGTFTATRRSSPGA